MTFWLWLETVGKARRSVTSRVGRGYSHLIVTHPSQKPSKLNYFQ